MMLLMIGSLAACSGGPVGDRGLFGGPRENPEPLVEPAPAETPLAEAPGDEDGRFVGFTVASLGDASAAGLWLETPLVSEEGPGRVVSENGMQLVVTLRPSGGDRNSGSRLSLAGFQALGIPLTALPTLTVISDA
jgi:hypothetical protein